MRLKNISVSLGTSVFKAFSEESRVRILNLIFQNGEMCISDLEQILEFTQTKTSRHLTYLKNAGLLANHKRDQWVYYYIKDEFVGIVSQIFGLFEKDALLTQDIENYRTLYANNILAIRQLHNKENKYILPEL